MNLTTKQIQAVLDGEIPEIKDNGVVGVAVKDLKNIGAHMAKMQQRINELEVQVRSISLSRDELSATVERLRDAGTKLRDDIDLSKIVGAGKRNFTNEWDDVISSTPAANLNAIKRDVLLGLLSTMTCGECTCDRHVEHYANKKYPSVKE